MLTGEQIRGKVIGSSYGHVQCVTFSTDDTRLAVCAGDCVHLLNSQKEECHVTLEGHGGIVTCAEFPPNQNCVLISASEDRTFKIWDIEEQCLIYQSCIISSSSFVSLSVHQELNIFALGTSDGQIRIYDLYTDNGYRQLHQISLEKIIKKYKQSTVICTDMKQDAETCIVSSRPRWQQAPGSHLVDSLPDNTQTEISDSVMALYFTSQSDTQSDDVMKSDLFSEPDMVSDRAVSPCGLLVGTPSAIIVINIKTLDCIKYIDLLEPLPCGDDVIDHVTPVKMAGSYAFSSGLQDNQYWCLVSSLFQSKSHIISLTTTYESSAPSSISLTVLSSGQLLPNSPLRAELRPKALDKPKTSKSSFDYSPAKISGGLDKKGKIAGKQAIVVRTKIRSSGYGSEPPRSSMFKPRTNCNVKKKINSGDIMRSRSQSIDGSRHSDSQDVYPICTEDPTVIHNTTMSVLAQTCAINKISFRGDGQYLACALSNSSTHVYKLPLSSDKLTALTGHKTSITNLHWSQDDKWLMTSSEKCACVHMISQTQPVMSMERVKDNFDLDKDDTMQLKDRQLLLKNVSHAQFYYMDQFILVSSGNSINLYKYHLDTNKSDLKRYQSNSRYKLVTSLGMTDSQSITAMSAINTFYSYLVLSVGSDKSMQVFDLNKGVCVCTIRDTHTRPVQTLVQNEGSQYGTHQPGSYDIFYTAAAGDCIKQWDLRSQQNVRRYEGHMNRVHSCGLSLSPCGRYLATGAEDKSAYIYDLRYSSYLHKLTQHTDVVSDVAFHPRTPKLITASTDGQLRQFDIT